MHLTNKCKSFFYLTNPFSKEKNYNDKDKVLEEKAFMHKENQRKVKELQHDIAKEKAKKQKVINEYK